MLWGKQQRGSEGAEQTVRKVRDSCTARGHYTHCTFTIKWALGTDELQQAVSLPLCTTAPRDG